jgi:hypothetical protein
VDSRLSEQHGIALAGSLALTLLVLTVVGGISAVFGPSLNGAVQPLLDTEVADDGPLHHVQDFSQEMNRIIADLEEISARRRQLMRTRAERVARGLSTDDVDAQLRQTNSDRQALQRRYNEAVRRMRGWGGGPKRKR